VGTFLRLLDRDYLPHISDSAGAHSIYSCIEPHRLSTCTQSPKMRRRKVQKFGAFHTLVLTLAILDLLGTIAVSPITFLLYSKEKHIVVSSNIIKA